MPEIAIDTCLFVLPPDVMIVPVRTLGEGIRRQIASDDRDFAVSRPRMRRPSKVLDPSSAALLEEFRTPSNIADAVLRHSRRYDLNPFHTLDGAFPALQSLVAGEILVPADSVAARAIESSFVAGMCVGGVEIVRLVQGLEDSELYEAASERHGRVALKVLRAGASSDAREMFAREAATTHSQAHDAWGWWHQKKEHWQTSCQRHPQEQQPGTAAPRLLSRGTAGDVSFFALEWIDGTHVGSAAARMRCADARPRLHRLCWRVLSAFADLHRHGVLHGDVHPGNILVRTDGVVVVLDFARSRRVARAEPSVSAARAGICYFYEPEMALELIDGRLPPDTSGAGEQYALAALVYCLLTGQHYQDFSLEQSALLQQVASLPPLPFASRGVPPWPEVETVLGRALRKDPRDRFASVDEFARAFRHAGSAHARSAARRSSLAATLIEELDLSGSLFRAAGPEKCGTSIASGSAGLAYLLYRACLIRRDPHLLTLADAWAEQANAEHADAADDAASVLHGAAGIHFTRALIAGARHDRTAWASAVRAFLRTSDREVAGSDVFSGATGMLIAAGEMVSTPLARLMVANGARDRLQSGACDELRSWMQGTMSAVSPSGLPVDGIAHGDAGRLYAILRAARALAVRVPDRALDALERLATRPPSVWPGWCRGSAGMISLWIIACELDPRHRAFRDLGERDALRAWFHRDRNPDLCCGLSGRTLALLQWYRHTGERVWLRRARALARLAESRAELAGSRFGLWKGAAGVALASVELEAPETAAMPLFH